MKILHCCLAAFYIDDYSYQENILPKFHQKQGHEVKILASTETYLSNLKLGYLKGGTYFSNDGIEITRLCYSKFLPQVIMKKLRIYNGVFEHINKFKPDVIFLHDCQFLSILSIVNYAKKNRVKIYVDCHTDFINSGKNWISRVVLHGFIYRFCANKISRYTTKFYGTLPLRIEFLNTVYKIPREKIELLPFGSDDSLYDIKNRVEIKSEIRNNLKISATDFVIITGGKIDLRKNIHILLRAFTSNYIRERFPNSKLILFGKPNKDIENEILALIKSDAIIYIDWLPSNDIHKYLMAADIAFFPGTHSVLWEEAIGLGLPAIFYKWDGIQHYDLGGNCEYIDFVDEIGLIGKLENIMMDIGKFREMEKAAQKFGPKKFVYSEISKIAIENKS